MNTKLPKFKVTEIGVIPEDWKVRSIGSIAEIIGGGTPKTQNKEYWGGEIPWLSVVDFGDSRHVYETEKSITKIGLENSSTKILDTGMLVLSARGTVGEVVQLGRPMAFNQSCYGLNAKPETSNDFLYYLLKNSISTLKQKTHGAVFDTITRNTLEEVFVPFPPEEEQQRITSILSSLDNKIELNRKINSNLEKIASALFKRWFVDFEFPDENGKPYKSSGGKMMDSEMGEIPEGWRVGKLGEVAKNIKRSVKVSDIDANKPYIGLEHMPRQSISLSEWGNGEGLGSNKFKFQKGEILFGKLRPYFHKVGVAPMDGICSTDILVIAPNEHDYFGFVLGHVSSSFFIKHTEGSSAGTRMPRTSWSDMAQYRIALPPKSVAAVFTRILDSFVETIFADIYESHALAEQRDLLLSRLLSGKIRAVV